MFGALCSPGYPPVHRVLRAGLAPGPITDSRRPKPIEQETGTLLCPTPAGCKLINEIYKLKLKICSEQPDPPFAGVTSIDNNR